MPDVEDLCDVYEFAFPTPQGKQENTLHLCLLPGTSHLDFASHPITVDTIGILDTGRHGKQPTVCIHVHLLPR